MLVKKMTPKMYQKYSRAPGYLIEHFSNRDRTYKNFCVKGHTIGEIYGAFDDRHQEVRAQAQT